MRRVSVGYGREAILIGNHIELNPRPGCCVLVWVRPCHEQVGAAKCESCCCMLRTAWVLVTGQDACMQAVCLVGRIYKAM